MFLLGCKQEIKATTTIQIYDSLQTKNDTEKAIKFLKEFYFSVYGSDENNEILKKKYLSERILKRIDSLTSNENDIILDYDPFIQGQDYNSSSIKKTLKIVPLDNIDEFRISFLLFGSRDEKRTNIDVALQKNGNGNYLINNILNDEYLNFKDDTSKKEQNGFYVLDSINLNTQTDTYKISVLEKIENKNKKNAQHNSNPIILYKNGKKIAQNNNLIYPYNDNCPADGFQRIVSKNNYFTIEQTYCKDFMFVQSYTTFKINDDGSILLHRYGEEYTDRSNPDKDIKNIIKTPKEFGRIKFENITGDFLRKLIQK
jgi:hypothetical protein